MLNDAPGVPPIAWWPGPESLWNRQRTEAGLGQPQCRSRCLLGSPGTWPGAGARKIGSPQRLSGTILAHSPAAGKRQLRSPSSTFRQRPWSPSREKVLETGAPRGRGAREQAQRSWIACRERPLRAAGGVARTPEHQRCRQATDPQRPPTLNGRRPSTAADPQRRRRTSARSSASRRPRSWSAGPEWSTKLIMAASAL